RATRVLDVERLRDRARFERRDQRPIAVGRRALSGSSQTPDPARALVGLPLRGLYDPSMANRDSGGNPEAEQTDCAPNEHSPLPQPRYDDDARERAVRLFKALGDGARLRTLEMLVGRDACVSELAE